MSPGPRAARPRAPRDQKFKIIKILIKMNLKNFKIEPWVGAQQPPPQPQPPQPQRRGGPKRAGGRGVRGPAPGTPGGKAGKFKNENFRN